MALMITVKQTDDAAAVPLARTIYGSKPVMPDRRQVLRAAALAAGAAFQGAAVRPPKALLLGAPLFFQTADPRELAREA